MSKFDFLNKFKKIDRNIILVCIAVLAVIITGVLIFVNTNHSFAMPSLFGISDSQLAKEAIDYINNNKLSQTPASLVNVSEASGLVKVKIKIGTTNYDSYVTKDGKLFFPQAFDISKTSAANNTTAKTTTPTAVTKSDKPMLEAFIVSSCPFGLQMQRAIVEAVKENSALASNVTIRYIGNVNSSGKTIDSMHGPEEGAENLRQICIREEQPSKFYKYLACYMQKTTATASGGMPLGDSTGCQTSTGIDTAKLNACVSDPSRGLAYAQKDFDENAKYNVSGSPTLILDGAQVDETGFGGRSADGVQSMVCAGYNTKPSFCSTKLNTAAAATSFAANYSGSSSSSANTQCGS